MPTWTKEMALEIISAGYKSMARKYHPDVGGTHEQMLGLTASKEHLEKVINGASDFRSDSFSYNRGPDWNRASANRREEDARKRRQYWRNTKADEAAENIPIEPYPHDDDYFQIADVTIMAITEKAYKIKITGIRQPQWLPKSQLHEEMDLNAINDGDVLTIVFTRWIAQQKGWLK